MSTQQNPDEVCMHCSDRRDGFYGSWAAPCPYHDDDGKPRPTAKAAPQQEMPAVPALATSETHWNQAPCAHCGHTEGQHFNARCHHIHGETRYTPTPQQAAPAVPTGKQPLQVQVWVLPNGKGGGQFSWEPQDERFWTKLAPQQEVQEPSCATCGKKIIGGAVRCSLGRNCWVGQQPAPSGDAEAAPQQEVQEPVLFVSPEQLANLVDTLSPFGKYLPARKTSAGKFTQPLYTAQPAPQKEVREPAAWLEYARKKPALRRLVFTKTPDKELRVAGWVAEPLSLPQPAPSRGAWKDGDTAALVNELRDVAEQYRDTQQLRERIARIVRPLAERVAPSRGALDLLEEVAACFTRDDDLPNGLLPRIDAMLRARKKGNKS